MNDLISLTMSGSALLCSQHSRNGPVRLNWSSTIPRPRSTWSRMCSWWRSDCHERHLQRLPGTQTERADRGLRRLADHARLDNGMLLSTGGVDSAQVPNDGQERPRYGAFPGPTWAGLGSSQTFDAAVLEFDFIPMGIR